MYQLLFNKISHIIKDPIPTLIEKLSSEDDILVRLSSSYDNINFHEPKKNLVQIKSDLNEKGYHSVTVRTLPKIFSNKRCPNFPNQEQKFILSKLRYIPCYTVVNNDNEIVMASPRVHKNYNSLDWLRNKYYETFFWSSDKGSVSLGLFFMNKEDAATYLHEICKREPKESEIHGLKIKTIGLDVFYRFNRTSPPKIQTRLIGDLKEIDLLLRTNIKQRYNTINSKQKYSNYWFQGTPIYSFKMHLNSKEKDIVSYSSLLKDENGKKIIFFNQEDAIKAWRCYVSKTDQTYLTSTPSLEIYNLENLLLDLENGKTDSVLNTMVMPPLSCYQSKTNKEFTLAKNQENDFSRQVFKTKLKLKEFERFYKGLIWLFTSDTLPSEENSW